MDDIRMLVVGDIHLSDQAPGKRADSYTEDILAKCEECVDIAHREKATHVLLLGDVFDNKNPKRTSHNLVQRIGDILLRFNLPTYILVGNHDIDDGTLDTLPNQPLGILGKLPNVTLLQWNETRLDDDVVLIPVPGIPLDKGADGNFWKGNFVVDSHNYPEKRRIVVAHQLIVPDVMVYPEKARPSFYAAKDIAEVTHADIVLYGDVHTKHGIYKLPNGHGGSTVFSNLGSLCRLSVDDVDHKPEVLLLTIKGDEKRGVDAKVIPITCVRPAEEVYRLEEHYEAKEHQEDIDEAVRRISATRVHKFSIDMVMDDIKVNESADEDVRDKAIELIEAVR